jgi:DNA-binding response OmpR family regulator
MQRIFLLVDDDTDDFNLLNDAINAADPTVRLFHIATESEIYSWFKDNPTKTPELILLDIYDLGSFDGWEILTRLKKQGAIADIPVIVYTVDPTFEYGKLARSEAVGILKKPITMAGMKALAEMLVTTEKQNWLETIRRYPGEL